MIDTVNPDSGKGSAARELLSVVLIIFFSVILVNAVNFDSFQKNLELFSSRYGIWSIIFIMLIVALCYSAAVPSTILGAASGAALGFVGGFILYAAAAFTSSITVYYFSRTILKDPLQKRIRINKYLGQLEKVIEKESLTFLFFIRFVPVHATFVNIFFGAAGINPRKFLLSCLFLIPELLLHVYTGYCAVSISTVQHGGWDIADTARVVSLILAIGAFVYIGRIAGKMKKTAKAAD